MNTNDNLVLVTYHWPVEGLDGGYTITTRWRIRTEAPTVAQLDRNRRIVFSEVEPTAKNRGWALGPLTETVEMTPYTGEPRLEFLE